VTAKPRQAPGVRNLLGPYESWMFGPGRSYDLAGLSLADEASLSCVAEFPDGGAFGTRRLQGGLRALLPTLYRPGGWQPRFLPFLLNPPARMTLPEVEAVQDALAGLCGGPAGAGYFRLNFPLRAATIDPGFRATARAGEPDPGVDATKPMVILAVIDHGIPFAHAAFRHQGRTRIDYCWAQTAATDKAGDVLFGREFTGRRIGEMLTAAGGDEDAVYREAGLLSRPGLPPMPLDGRASHGAHVLDLLAGQWDEATAAQARIIAVDLPATSTWETSGFGTDMFLLAALHYIFDRADRIAAAHGVGPLPVVVNLSYGWSGGPHDGSGFIEAAMDELILERRKLAPTALVLPAGNMFQDRLNALLTDAHFTGKGQAQVQWFAPPDDRTSSFLELWFPPGTALDDISVQVTPPGADAPANRQALIEQEAGVFYSAPLLLGGKIVGQYSVDLHRDRRWRATVILAPTDPKGLPDAAHRAAPAGVWTVAVTRPKGVLAGGGGIECRIQIDTQSLQGNTGARQSRFVEDGDPFASDGTPANADPPGGAAKVRRFGSLNGMAVNRTALVIGGHQGEGRRAAEYSGGGALRQVGDGAPMPIGRQVDASAPSERSFLDEGVLAAGTRSGITVQMQGTSVAAPQAARWLALALLRQGMGDTAESESDPYLALLGADPAASLPGPASAADRLRLGKLRLRGLSRGTDPGRRKA
jgi:hypothetical protein